MTRVQVQSILEEHFPETALIPMLDDYEAMMKNLLLRNYDLVLVFGGRMVESLFVCLSYFTDDPMKTAPNFTRIQKDLEQKKNDELPSSIRVIMPRAAKTIYDLRSKRNAVHVNPAISPSYIDAVLVLSIAQWILAELIRVLSVRSPEDIAVLLRGLVDRRLPIVEEIMEVPVILESDVSAHDSILIILYSRYPDSVTKAQLIEFLPDFTDANIRTSLRNAEKDKLVFRHGDDNYLTKKGIQLVEDRYGDRYFGGGRHEQ